MTEPNGNGAELLIAGPDAEDPRARRPALAAFGLGLDGAEDPAPPRSVRVVTPPDVLDAMLGHGAARVPLAVALRAQPGATSGDPARSALTYDVCLAAARHESPVAVVGVDSPAVARGSSTDGRVLITGTGRAGTTLLIQILTRLGLDTGFETGSEIDGRVHAGLERAFDDPDSPHVVKSPDASRRLGPVLDARDDVAVGHVVIPMRSLDVAAASRVRNTRYGADLHTWGGLFGTNRATDQSRALARIFAELMETVARHHLPFTLVEFPRFALDAGYCHRRLGFLTPDLGVDAWQAALTELVDPALIHETPLSTRERVLTRAGTLYNRVLVRPWRGLRRTIGRPR